MCKLADVILHTVLKLLYQHFRFSCFRAIQP